MTHHYALGKDGFIRRVLAKSPDLVWYEKTDIFWRGDLQDLREYSASCVEQKNYYIAPRAGCTSLAEANTYWRALARRLQFVGDLTCCHLSDVLRGKIIFGNYTCEEIVGKTRVRSCGERYSLEAFFTDAGLSARYPQNQTMNIVSMGRRREYPLSRAIQVYFFPFAVLAQTASVRKGFFGMPLEGFLKVLPPDFQLAELLRGISSVQEYKKLVWE